MFRKLRIAILLLILLFVALNTYFDRVYSTDWNIPLRVRLLPINADGSDEAERYIGRLQVDHFAPVEVFFTAQAARYGVHMDRPVRIELGAPIRELPPQLPPGSGAINAIWWSLRTRYWAWRVPPQSSGPDPDVQLFLLYHDPRRTPALPHSVGLQKGLFGVVNLFADRSMQGSNDTVLSHELLHTLGATDKYTPGDNQPRHPDGFADPDRQPLYPQSRAELMGGRIPLSQSESRIPASLRQVVVGPVTAREIGWSGDPRTSEEP